MTWDCADERLDRRLLNHCVVDGKFLNMLMDWRAHKLSVGLRQLL